ncbi:hypothetical protein GO755_04970 [Spirosoma sp. HMF4905]|uniref:Uncharacterized protein n=1 Tax=Spirosoma arboris TaxID=2682092 RepID=A0A7K1S731_9BACT|nr:hypothetical protein [Spirosoma arboris]MVM29376.1 hypothetical protein [Spirosoma arboris]
MTPLSSNPVLPERLNGITETEVQPLSSPIPIASPAQLVGSTSSPVIPVLPSEGTPPVESVNPVNNGNLAGLPHSDTDGITDGIIPKTFKLPTSVMRSIERAVDELNKVTPGNTTHAYGVNLLTRHEELLRAAGETQRLTDYCERLSQRNTQLITELLQARSENVELTKLLPGGQDLPGIPRSTPPVDASWRVRYEQVTSELQKALEAHALEKRAAQPVYALVKVLPDLLEQLYQEASSDSWRTPQYYQQFFQELLAPYLDSE